MEREPTTIEGRDISTKLQQSTQPQAPLRGSVLVLIQFDVCEEIRLDELRKIFPPVRPKPVSRRLLPTSHQRTPVEETLEPLTLESGERLAGEIKYYDYGVVSLESRTPFSGSWDTLVQTGLPLDLRHQLRKAGHAHRQAEAVSAPPPRLHKPYTGVAAARTTLSSTSARSKALRPPPSFSPRRAFRSPRSCAEKPRASPMASARRFCRPAFLTIRTI